MRRGCCHFVGGIAALVLLTGCGDPDRPGKLDSAAPFLTSLNLNNGPSPDPAHLPRSEFVLLQGVSDTAWPRIRATYSTNGYATCWRSPAGPGPGMKDSADPGRLAVIARADVSPQVVSNLTFRIEGNEYAPSHPPVHVSFTNATGRSFRFWNLHMHSKAWHPAGQHEVRRNEARLAWQEVRKQTKSHPGEVVLIGATMNDDPGSAAVDYFTNNSIANMQDVRPIHEADGSAWTHHQEEDDHWVRHDYLFVRIPESSTDSPRPPISSLGERRSDGIRRPLHLDLP